jgi:hypothetical protein
MASTESVAVASFVASIFAGNREVRAVDMR